MKKIITLALVFIFSISAFAKIGVVDTSKILANYSGAKTVEQNLSASVKRLEQEAASKNAALEKEQAELIAKGNKLTAKEQENFEKKVYEFRKFISDSQEKLDREKEQKLDEIQNKLMLAAQAVAREGGYESIFQKGAILAGGEDVTDKVLRKMESMK